LWCCLLILFFVCIGFVIWVRSPRMSPVWEFTRRTHSIWSQWGWRLWFITVEESTAGSAGIRHFRQSGEVHVQASCSPSTGRQTYSIAVNWISMYVVFLSRDAYLRFQVWGIYIELVR
jgi:hypothetical protein